MEHCRGRLAGYKAARVTVRGGGLDRPLARRQGRLPLGQGGGNRIVTRRPAVGGEVLVAAAAGLWALIGVCTRELGDLGVPAAEVGTWRALIGGACFLAHLAVTAARRPPARGPAHGPGGGAPTAATLWSMRVPLVAFCLVGVVVFYVSLPLAVETGGVSLAYVLLYTAPLWVMLGARVVLGEHPARVQVVAGGVAVAGVAGVVASAGGTVEVTVVSVGWGLVAGLSYSSYYLWGRRLFDRVGAVAVHAVILPLGAVVLAALLGLTAPTAAMAPWLVLLGVGCTYLPYLLFGTGITRTGSSRAVVVAMVEPVLAASIGVVAYDERLGALGVLGAIAVVGAATTVGLYRSGPRAGRAGEAEYSRPT